MDTESQKFAGKVKYTGQSVGSIPWKSGALKLTKEHGSWKLEMLYDCQPDRSVLTLDLSRGRVCNFVCKEAGLTLNYKRKLGEILTVSYRPAVGSRVRHLQTIMNEALHANLTAVPVVKLGVGLNKNSTSPRKIPLWTATGNVVTRERQSGLMQDPMEANRKSQIRMRLTPYLMKAKPHHQPVYQKKVYSLQRDGPDGVFADQERFIALNSDNSGLDIHEMKRRTSTGPEIAGVAKKQKCCHVQKLSSIELDEAQSAHVRVKQNEACHPMDAFFKGCALQAKEMSKPKQAWIQMQISRLMYDAEMDETMPRPLPCSTLTSKDQPSQASAPTQTMTSVPQNMMD